MECIDLKHTDTINTNVLFPAQLMGGGENLWSSGSGAGLLVELVLLFYIIRLWASLLICRQARE